MGKMTFKDAYYIKLGKQGIWENELEIGEKVRVGWKNIELSEIHNQNWEGIKETIKEEFGEKKGATQDFNALKSFCEATEDDVIITFSNGKLYWCFLDNNEVEQDGISKYRTTKIKWSYSDINGRTLYINKISGRITKTQGFRATLCRIDEKESLRRTINAEIPPIVEEIHQKKKELVEKVSKAFTELHWRDLEILADLIFRQSGWRRISETGEKMKYVDLVLQDPITQELFQVQVKSGASKSDFEDYVKKFSSENYSKFFFVVFNPDKSFDNFENSYENVQLLTGMELAELIIDLGLTKWVTDKIS